MKEIGLTLGVVESRVSQIHSSAVLHLRAALAGLRSGGAPSSPSDKFPDKRRNSSSKNR